MLALTLLFSKKKVVIISKTHSSQIFFLVSLFLSVLMQNIFEETANTPTKSFIRSQVGSETLGPLLMKPLIGAFAFSSSFTQPDRGLSKMFTIEGILCGSSTCYSYFGNFVHY